MSVPSESATTATRMPDQPGERPGAAETESADPPLPALFDDVMEGERSATPLPTYGRTCETMRDTTKWILSFVPGAALLVTLGGVVPDVAALAPAERSEPIRWLIAAAVLVGVATALAVWVLATDPPGWNWISATYQRETGPGARPGERSFSRELDGSGILLLFGYRSAKHFFAVISQERPDHVKHALGAGGTILDFAYLRDLRRRFVVFVAAGSVAAVGAVACIAIARGDVADATRARAAAALERPPRVGAPLQAEVFPTAAGVRRLQRAGCSPADAAAGVSVWVIAGDLSDGTVVVSEDGCVPTTLRHWVAATHGVIVPSDG